MSAPKHSATLVKVWFFVECGQASSSLMSKDPSSPRNNASCRWLPRSPWGCCATLSATSASRLREVSASLDADLIGLTGTRLLHYPGWCSVAAQRQTPPTQHLPTALDSASLRQKKWRRVQMKTQHFCDPRVPLFDHLDAVSPTADIRLSLSTRKATLRRPERSPELRGHLRRQCIGN